MVSGVNKRNLGAALSYEHAHGTLNLPESGLMSVEVLQAAIKDFDLRARASYAHASAVKIIAEAIVTVSYATRRRPSTPLTITIPRPVGKLRARLARMLGRSEVPIDNRALIRAFFDEEYYINRYQIVLEPGQKTLDHYLIEGRRRGLSPHPLIDTDWYEQNRPATAPKVFDLVAYLATPARFRDPVHPLFNADYYFEHNPEVEAAGVNPLAHYRLYGWLERRSPNSLFDSDWYLADNPEVLESGVNPLTHYAKFGAGEGRRPHLLFDRAYYLRQNPEVGQSGLDGFIHYVAFGQFEGRAPSGLVEEIARDTGWDVQSIAATIVPSGSKNVPTVDAPWHPKPRADYVLPHDLRQFIGDEFGASRLPLYSYLMSVIAYFSDQPGAFAKSDDCADIVARARTLSGILVADSSAEPEVTIVIPAFNNLLYTLTAILSVLETAGSTTFEIIVADDSSSDETPDVIGKLGGVVRLKRNALNLGFLKNCNAAAERARGRVLVFLNNDVLVLPGWLDALVAPLTESSIGFIGSRLLSSDGRLQEAGGVLWNDGSASNFGRGGRAGWPEHGYLKDVDYVSGASIAIDGGLWRRLGGFDPIFSPAYSEDADLAFRVRQAGHRTVYQPASSVIHHEGQSHGRDLSSGIKAYQIVNQAKFLERWKDVLERENFASGSEVFLARDRSRDKPHILIVDHYIPQWDRDAGSRTVHLYIKFFIDQGFAITFWPDNLRNDREYGDVLRQMGVEIICHPTGVSDFSEWVRENGRYLDYALLCRPHIADKYIDALRASSPAKLLYYGMDLHHKRLEAADALAPISAGQAEADRWKEIEYRVCIRCDVVMYPGNHEVEVVKSWTPPGVSVVDFPITIFSDAEIATARLELSRRASAGSYELLFVGGFAHEPNVGGVAWFVTEVMPRLRKMDPRFRLQIVGSNAPQAVMALAGPDVNFLGRISDSELEKRYNEAGLAIVPLLFGAGVKGKVVEAMGRGIPVVMTSVGAQGLPGAESFAVVEDDAQKMAEAILRAAANPVEAVARASLALDLIEARFSTNSVKRLLGPFMPELSRLPGHSHFGVHSLRRLVD